MRKFFFGEGEYSPKKWKMSCQSIIEAISKTGKLFELPLQTEKNKLFEKAPEQSFMEISKQFKLRIFLKFIFCAIFDPQTVSE